MPSTSPEAIKRRAAARIAKREAAKAAKAAAVNEPAVNEPAVTEPVVNEPEATGGFPGSAPPPPVSSGIASVPKFENVDTDTVVEPERVRVPVVLNTPEDDPFRAWLRTPQGLKLSHLGGVNMARLGPVYADRVEAAFRAGYGAGVDDGI